MQLAVRSSLWMWAFVLVASGLPACGEVHPKDSDAGTGGQTCASSTECDGTAPYCVEQACAAACTDDMQCPGAGEPSTDRYCVSGACVACRTDDECTADAPICDQDSHACVACSADSECASNVCVESEGRCAGDSEVIYLTMFGDDTGECTKAAPCLTLQYASTKVTPNRTVIQLLGGTFSVGTGTVTLNGPMIIDGTPTAITGPFDMPLFAAKSGAITIENVTMKVTTSGPTVSATNLSSLRLYNVTMQRNVDVNNATLAVEHSTFVRNGGVGTFKDAVTCTQGTVLVDQSRFDYTAVSTANCQLTVKRSWFEEDQDRSINASGGLVTLENNVIVESYELADVASVSNVLPGSVVRFNTFVNTSSIDSDGVALACDTTVNVTSNIFAYRSQHPHGPSSTCQTRYSLYDQVSVQTTGTGNKIGDGATFFVDRGMKDFHLAANSPAKDSGEPLPIDIDYDGAARPQPAGSNPDIGAFEAP